MTRIILVTCILATLTILASCKHAEDQKAAPSPPNSTAPAPSSDCMSIVFDMEDCIPYLSLVHDADPEPADACCSGFMKVAKTDADCVCLAIKGSADYGITLNMTRVKGLPGLCKFPAGNKVMKSCLASMAPGASPPGNNPPRSSPELPPPKKSPEPSPPSKSPPMDSPSAPKASPPQEPPSPPAAKGGGTVIMASAPAPVKGGAHVTSVSLMVLSSLLLASFSLALV